MGGRTPGATAEEKRIAPQHGEPLEGRQVGEAAADFSADGLLKIGKHGGEIRVWLSATRQPPAARHALRAESLQQRRGFCFRASRTGDGENGDGRREWMRS